MPTLPTPEILKTSPSVHLFLGNDLRPRLTEDQLDRCVDSSIGILTEVCRLFTKVSKNFKDYTVGTDSEFDARLSEAAEKLSNQDPVYALHTSVLKQYLKNTVHKFYVLTEYRDGTPEQIKDYLKNELTCLVAPSESNTMTPDEISTWVKDAFSKLSKRKDLKQLSINFVNKEAEDLFFSSISANDWCQLIDHNQLEYCVLRSLYTERESTHWCDTEHVLSISSLSKDHASCLIEHHYPLIERNSAYASDQQKHRFSYLLGSRRVPSLRVIDELFTRVYAEEKGASKIHDAFFRSLMFQFLFDEHERAQMAEQSPDIVNEFIINKLFNQLQEQYENDGYEFVTDNGIRLNELPVNFLMRLFDKVVENHSPALQNWCTHLAQDRPNLAFNLNIARAVEEQLRANKEVPLRKVTLIKRDGDPCDLLWRLSQFRHGKGTIEAHYIDDQSHRGEYEWKLNRIVQAQSSERSSIDLVYDLKVRFQMESLSQKEIDLLLQIRENAAARLRKRTVHNHKLQSVAPETTLGAEKNVALDPIPYVTVVNGTKKRQKDRVKINKLKIQQQIQAQVGEQTMHQQVSLTQVNQQLMALQNRQQLQQDQQQAVVPVETGRLLRRAGLFSYWYEKMQYTGLPLKNHEEAIHLWDAVTATISPQGTHAAQIDAISAAAWQVICENSTQFLGGLEFNSGFNHLPQGFYVQEDAESGQKQLCYSKRFYVQPTTTKTPALRQVILKQDEAPDVPLDLLASNVLMKKIFDACAVNWRKEKNYGTFESKSTLHLYEIREYLSRVGHLLLSEGDATLDRLLSSIQSAGKAKWKECIDTAIREIDENSLTGPTHWQGNIQSKLNEDQRAVVHDFTPQEWMRLETVFFQLDHYGVDLFLTSMAELKAARPESYEHFRKTFLASSRNWAMLMSPSFSAQISRLAHMPSGTIALWKTLVTEHLAHAKVIDFAKMMPAFEGFLKALEDVDSNYTIPKNCTVVDAKNFFTSLSRLLNLMQLSLDPQDQLKHLSGLSLSAVGAVYPFRHEGFHAARTTMTLTPEQTVTAPVLMYATSEQVIADAIANQQVTCEALQVLLHRYLAKVDYSAGFDAYGRVLKSLKSAEGYSEKDKKLAFSLSVWTSIGARQLRDLNDAVLHDALAPLLSALSKNAHRNKTALLFPLPFKLKPSLHELNKWLACKDTEADIPQAIALMNTLLLRYGLLAWEHLLSPEVESVQGLEKHLQELNMHEAGNFLVKLDEFLVEFSADEQQQLRTLIQLIPGYEIEEVGLRLIDVSKNYKATKLLIELLPLLIDGVRQKIITAKNAEELITGLTLQTVPNCIISTFLRNGPHLAISDEQIKKFILPAFTSIANAKTLPSRQQQIAATHCLRKLLEAKLEVPEPAFRFFLESLSDGRLIASQVKYIFATIDQETLRALEPFYAEQALHDVICKVLNTNPSFLKDAAKYPESFPLFLEIISRQITPPSEKDAKALSIKLNELSQNNREALLNFYKKPPYPTVSGLLGVKQALKIDEQTLERLDKEPYGPRNLEAQLDNSQVFRELSNFENLFADKKFDMALRRDMLRRLRTLNKEAIKCAQMTTSGIEDEINKLTNSPVENINESAQLELLALLREYAYRTVPGKDCLGLFANTSQMLAVLDSVFHQGNLGLQVSTGEGKTLIIALMSSFKTISSNNAVDLVTSNATLASRDLAEFRSFYEGCQIKTSLIGAKSPLTNYIQHGRGINISDLGGMALFQGKHLYEGTLSQIDNDLILDEGDDALLDKRTQFNHPKQLKGDSSQSSANSPIAWIYPHLMAFVETPEFQQGKTRQDDVINAMRYLQTHGNVEIEALMPLSEELNVWLDAALTVREDLEQDVHYRVVHEVRVINGEETKVRYARIATDGRLDYEAQWGDGVQQLLHAKLNAQAIARGEEPNFVIDPEQDVVHSSTAKNVLRRYKRILSLTATPGSTAERYECSRKYAMDFHVIPPHNPLNRSELPTRYAEDNSEFEKMIAHQMLDCHQHKKPLVIVCETHRDVEKLQAHIKKNKQLSKIKVQALTGSNPAEEESVIANAGEPGMVTISTAMISRGTDIQLRSPKHGLRVLQTYLSKERINIQVKGRAGRRGQSGEYGLLIDVNQYKNEFPQLNGISDRYYSKHTGFLDHLWGNREQKEVISRQREESIGDIKDLLNQLFGSLNRERQLMHQPINDEEERRWHKLLTDFDQKTADLAETDQDLHEQLSILVDWSALAWGKLWNQQTKEIQQKLQPQSRHFYQSYADYIRREDTFWYGLTPEDAEGVDLKVEFEMDTEGLFEQEKTRANFVEKINQWNDHLKSKAKNDVEQIENKIVSAYAKHKPEAIVTAAKKVAYDCYIAHTYDRNLDGYAKIYSGLFCDTRAILLGERPLFANFRAWWNGHGVLFADTRAVLAGIRPVFANIRMFFLHRAVDAEIKKIDKLCSHVQVVETDEKQLELQEMKEQLVSMRNMFFEKEQLQALSNEVDRIIKGQSH